MKRGTLKKQSGQKISVIQRQLWQLCKEIIRKKYGSTCYTCGQGGLAGSNWHTGHLWPKASLGSYMKYDLRVLRPQCYRCNIHLGGNGAVFYEKMCRENGDGYMSGLEKEKQISVKALDHYLALVPKYQEMLRGLIN